MDSKFAEMERLIRQITEQLTEKLPADREFYHPEDLQVLDIPEFITERVVLEMNHNLAESLAPPVTEWAKMDADAVQFAWKNFIDAIRAEVRMPASYAKSLFEAAVGDTLELAIRPRQSIPESLFGPDQELTIAQVKKRIRYITVGRQLAAALVRYMEKKDKKSLTLSDCREIVAKVDEKLISGYNSLDWAKETEPLFLLAGPKVDTELLRVFFEDKNRPRIAAKFDSLNTNVNRTGFIEILSTPDIDPDTGKEVKPVDEKPAVKDTDDFDEGRKKPKKAPAGEKLFIPEDSILGSFQKRRTGSLLDDPQDEEQYHDSDADEKPADATEAAGKDSVLHERFRFDEEEAELSAEAGDEAERKGLEKDPGSIYDEMNFKREDDRSEAEDEGEDEADIGLPRFDPEILKKWQTIGGMYEDDDEPVLSETEKPEDEDEPVEIELYNETDDEEDVPMWRAFLEREDLSKVKEEEEESGSDDVDEESVYKISSGEPDEEETGDEASELDRWIGSERNRFISEIFGDSEAAYEDAITNVVDMGDWKSASRYIQKEVFNRNGVDLFDEVAVDFTDRLHTFFIENKS
jgi:hypothetical protein